MAVIVPKSVRIEIELILKGVKRSGTEGKIPKKTSRIKETARSKEELVVRALKYVDFFHQIAEKEPINTFISKSVIMVLNDFIRTEACNKKGVSTSLCLAKVKGIAGIFYLEDADHPVNRSDKDFTRVTEEELNSWAEKSLVRFTEMTEKDIWRNILAWLRSYREFI